MPKEIWNEGRVVGLSAYEIYVKQHIADGNPNPPATEREWLASNLAMGASMLLKVPAVSQDEDEYTYVDIPMPATTNLCAANTIVGQYFDTTYTYSATEEDGEFENGSNWATRVNSYGPMISNTHIDGGLSNTCPDAGYIGTNPGSAIPSFDFNGVDMYYMSTLNRVQNYCNILDGVIIQPGTWSTSDLGVSDPYMDLSPSISSDVPTVRLLIKGPINEADRPCVLLTGFTLSDILVGSTGLDGSTQTTNPQDGDFLGPAVFPWGARIMFSIPNRYNKYVQELCYERTGTASPTDPKSWNPYVPQPERIHAKSVIDIAEEEFWFFYDQDHGVAGLDPYYELYDASYSDPTVQYELNSFIGWGRQTGGNIFATLQKKSKFPPALYQGQVDSTQIVTHQSLDLHPVDIVAPGTVKMFYDATQSVMQEYQNTFPGTTAMSRTADGRLKLLDSNGVVVEVGSGYAATLTTDYLNSGDNSEPIYSGQKFIKRYMATSDPSEPTSYSGADRPRVVKIQSGGSFSLALMLDGTSNLSDPTHTQLEIWDTPPTSFELNSTNSDQNICWSALLEALRHNRSIDLLGARLKSAKTTLLGDNTGSNGYLEFGTVHSSGGGVIDGDPIRLYVSVTPVPAANVPEGSIGVGWGFDS